jgi:hypothetical protein
MITWIIIGGVIVALLFAYSILKSGGDADDAIERILKDKISNGPK